MVIASRLPANCSGLVRPSSHKQSLQLQRYQRTRLNYWKPNPLAFEKISGRNFLRNPSTSSHVVSVGSNRQHQLNYDDELPEVPFWLILIRDTIWSIRSLFAFLIEQPSQLKYIEWPSFQSTLKTATLTLVIVAVLIVALSSVDSVLCYILAMLLRKTPS
ncbi:Protein translocase complex, SecE/Sec61-gamma subunit [Corchorus olitorius]|uniref:Protein translocase complex, SecE/Sec61-gamma subunit n=1 Tax=Corchorus olitorius TaxID=93759 RepID=A0A1R3JCZ7_9ROSI|nr:Protein translocase complex, SecE/Sec61-gamma subunit [Corchorus olitorius]